MNFKSEVPILAKLMFMGIQKRIYDTLKHLTRFFICKISANLGTLAPNFLRRIVRFT